MCDNKTVPGAFEQHNMVIILILLKETGEPRPQQAKEVCLDARIAGGRNLCPRATYYLRFLCPI